MTDFNPWVDYPGYLVGGCFIKEKILVSYGDGIINIINILIKEMSSQ